LQRLEDVLVFRVHGQDNRARRRRLAMHFLCGIDAVQQWHREVEDGHVWMKITDQSNGFMAIGGFTNDVELLTLEKGPQPLSNDQVVLSEEDSE
jgi:hypothetical protein